MRLHTMRHIELVVDLSQINVVFSLSEPNSKENIRNLSLS